jgi:hypothetical protein
MDDVVVVESELVSNNLDVQKNVNVRGSIITKDLVVTGCINVDNKSWHELSDSIKKQTLESIGDEWQKKLTDQVLEQAKISGIDFESVSIGGVLLIQDGTLNPEVKHANLKTVGILDKLQVQGTTILNNTMHVHNLRIGINTDSPEMALSIWDEEVAIIAGKLSKQQAFIGTARPQNLAIGVNRNAQIEIDTDGLTTIKKLRVGRHMFGHSNEVPGYSGTRGDLMFNSNPVPGSPFAWVCLGSYQWQPLKAA